MAAIASGNITVAYDSGGRGERVMMLIIKDVDTADTIDLSSYFTEITQAPTGFTAGGGQSGVVVGGTTPNAITLTLSSMANDNVYLLVKGTSA